MIPEILSPAGDFERLAAAVTYGADAVYLGGKMFGMRSSPANFSTEELTRAVGFCHNSGVKVYYTVNTVPTNWELEYLPEHLSEAAKAGVDAFIAADLGVLSLAKKTTPEVPVHISTQAGVTNHLTANEFYRLGASRIILARELSLEDVKVIRDKTPPQLEIEAFVHGAVCMAMSGRCLISQYLLNRDANRGECAQPCRWGYHLMEEKREGQFFPVFEDERGTYILNAQDLCMLPYFSELAQAGITSFKIEGRAKSAYYVAAVTNAYRCAADAYAKNPHGFETPDWIIQEAQKVSHREYSTGFYFNDKPPRQYYESGGYVRDWEVVAVVEGYSDGCLICSERNRFSKLEPLELLLPKQKPAQLIVSEMYDENGESLETARHPNMTVRIKCDTPYEPGSMIRRCKTDKI